jgi:hypothetical protein
MELVIGQQSQLFQQINSLKLLQRVVMLDGLSSVCLLFIQMDKQPLQQSLEFQVSSSKK